MKVKTIRYAGKADVYNMEVDDTHDFAVGNGVIVHNCADESRYLCMLNPIPPRTTEVERVPEYDPLDTWKDTRKDPKEDFWLR